MVSQSDDPIAICGVSGRFASSSTTDEFKSNLFNGVDMISNDHQRWPWKSLNLPSRMGIVPDLDRFDSSFFGVNPKAADAFDPKVRKLLEVVFEAIVDSGENPNNLRGSNTGVFLGVTAGLNDPDNDTANGLFNRATSLMVNNISFCFDLKGPSYAVDTGCSSSFYALDQAVESIRSGACDQAIVAAAQVHLDPYESLEFYRVGVINKDGRCKTFCQDRDGYVKADAVVAIYIKRAQVCRRIYSYVEATGTNCDGFKNDGLLHPNSVTQKALIEKIYAAHKIDRDDVEYVEAHGTGTKVGDVEETTAIVDYFCHNNRPHKLKIGSVKTNSGHAEMASGLVSLTKVLIAMQSEMIPAILGFTNPAKDIPGICDGQLEVISKNTPYNGGLIAVNSFGFGGANSHVVLRPFKKPKTSPEKTVALPRLVQVSGRTEQAVENMIKKLIKEKSNRDFIALIDHIFNERSIDNYNYRGYVVLPSDSKNANFEISRCNFGTSEKRPIWFFYSGMGSQWPGMAKDLMQFDVFRQTMTKCANAVRPYGINLEEIVLSETTDYDNCVNCFTAIIAMAVSITDLIRSLGIEPDGIIGHSLGEVGCAYADGLLTAEQATLIAYARGYATSSTNNLISGLMASVGLSAEECQKILPSDIYLACDNSHDNVTISGPAESVKQFTKDLTNRGIFNKLINTAGYAFHSKYIHDAGNTMLNFIITNANVEKQPRSKKWLPTSVSENQWDTDLGKFNSAEYHWFNFMNPVQFSQVLKYIPKNAVLIEIGPKDLFRAIFRRSLQSSVYYSSLVKPKEFGDEDGFENILANIGKLYNNEVQTDLVKFYKSDYADFKFPVNQGTPSIGSLIQWDYTIKWKVPEYYMDKPFGEKYIIDINDPEYKFLTGHIVDGKNIFPGTGYMVLAWRTVAKFHSKPYYHLPVVIENMEIIEATFLNDHRPSILTVNIMQGSENFEIYNEVKNVVARGRIRVPKNINEEFLNYQHLPKANYNFTLTPDDFYKELHLRGYDYYDQFSGVVESSLDGRWGVLKWFDNWVTFIDTIMQHIVVIEQRELYVPTLLEKITIDPEQHMKALNADKEVSLDYNKYLKSALAGGVEIRKIHGAIIEKRNSTSAKPSLQKYEFIPYELSNSKIETQDLNIAIALQIVAENFFGQFKIKSDINLDHIKNMIPRNVLKKSEIVSDDTSYDIIISLDNIEEPNKIAKSCEFIITSTQDFDPNYYSFFNLVPVYINKTKSKTYIALKRTKPLPEDFAVIQASNDNFSWIEQLKLNLKKFGDNPKARVYLVSNDHNSGLVGLFNCLKYEKGCDNLRIYIMRDGAPEKFNLTSKFYIEQLRKDLTINVYSNGVWGCWKFMPLEKQTKVLVEEAYLEIGENNKLEWIKQQTAKSVSVYFASINESNPTASISPLEFAGVKEATNEKVMGICERGPVASSIDPHSVLTWKVPSQWSLEDACAIPKTYILTLYSLYFKSHLTPDKSILIHNGSDNYSQAAISLALFDECDVYVTVNNNGEKMALLKKFPSLDESHVLVYQPQEKIIEMTHGKGVNIIFNCHSQNLIAMSFQCAARFAHIINISNADIDKENSKLLEKKKCYLYKVELDDIFEDENLMRDVAAKFESYLRLGGIKALNHYTLDSIDDLLDYNFDNNKTVLKVKEKRGFFSRTAKKFLASSSTNPNPEKSYIIVGGLGGFSLELCNWLLRRGATKIILNGRRNVYNGYQSLCLEKWRANNKIVLVDTNDVTTLGGAKNLLELASNLGEIGGIFNLALVLKDGAIFEQTIENFNAVIGPKLIATQNLDYLSRKLCKNLDYFVCFSSMVASAGNPTQSNYGYANSAIERICETRKSEGLPGLACEWGPIGDVGFVARLKTKARFIEAIPQRIDSCLAVLDGFLQGDNTVVASCVYEDENGPAAFGRDKNVAMAVVGLFGIKDVNVLDDNMCLVNLGMDSLLSFEIRNMLVTDFGIEMNGEEIKKCTIKDLKAMDRR